MPTKSADYYSVVSAFIASIKGVDQAYLVGEIVQGDDPGLKANPDAFAPLIVRGAPTEEPEPEPRKAEAEKPVERATATPGEKRETAPPAGKAMTNDQLKGRSH